VGASKADLRIANGSDFPSGLRRRLGPSVTQSPSPYERGQTILTSNPRVIWRKLGQRRGPGNKRPYEGRDNTNVLGALIFIQ